MMDTPDIENGQRPLFDYENKDGIWLADWPLPESTTGWYINVEADGLIVSSDYHSGS